MLTHKKQRYPALAGIRSTIVGVIVNALLVVIKGVTGFLGNSYALIADAIESISDIFNTLIVWVGLKIASKPPDVDHPYGHGKAEPLAGAIVAIVLFGAAVIIIIQSTKEIITPHHAPASFTLIVLAVVIITKEFLFRFIFNVGKSIDSTAVKIYAWDSRSDAITSAAVFVGISIALIGGKGYESADDWAALFASGIIIFNAFRLVKPAIAELMDQAPSPNIELNIRKVASLVDGVLGLDKCYVRKVGFEFYVDLHVIVDGETSVRKGHEIAHKVKDNIRLSNPKIFNVLVHIEPQSK